MNTEELWIDRLRGAWTAPGPPPPSDHPSPEELWQAAHGELSAPATATIVDHLALCSECSEDWRLALALERERLVEEVAPPAVVRLPAPARRRWDPRWAAAAALVVAAIGGSLFLPESPPAVPPAYRGSESPAIESAVRDNAPVTRKGFTLAWKAVPGAVSYDLSVRTSSFAKVVEVTGLTRPEFDVPAEKLASLRPASHLFWQVEAVFPDGTRSARPATFRLTLVE